MYAKLTSLYAENRPRGNLVFLVLVIFLAVYFMPAGTARFDNAILEAFALVHWYAREHVVLCLLPAFVIAGAMAVYISQGSVMRFLGPRAPKPLALGVASVSGTLLAVCSCTVLPLFGGIYRRGAGLGAAVAFLYSGPAINVMAIIVTAKVLGIELGTARAVGAIVFAVVIGAIMHLLYRKEEAARSDGSVRGFEGADQDRSLVTVSAFFGLMVAILIFANWTAADNEAWMAIYQLKWLVTAALAALLALLLVVRWHWPVVQVATLGGIVLACVLIAPHAPELAFAVGTIGLMLIAAVRPADSEWAAQTWDFTKQIAPLLLAGVFVAGFLLGRPGQEGLVPSAWIAAAVGDNSLVSTMLASVVGAFMYFSTLTEVPIVQGLMGAGMGKGPALALLLAGPALSLPNMLVIRSILGTGKTVTYCVLVVVMATVTGFVFGNYF